MKKIILALAILGAGTGGFFAARQSASQLQAQTRATRQAWLVQSQLLEAAQAEQAGLVERIRQLKQKLSQTEVVQGENAVWVAVQTNGVNRLTPDLRERLLEELGFNWKSSQDFIVVSKQTLRDLQMGTIRQGKATDAAVAALALTPEERSQVDMAIQRVQADFKGWAISHVERSEPSDAVVAHYTLAGSPATSITNDFVTALLNAVGKERTELIMPSARNALFPGVALTGKPFTMVVRRYSVGNEQQLKVQTQYLGATNSNDLWQGPDRGLLPFPAAFRLVFLNGWAELAEREGFELPQEPQQK